MSAPTTELVLLGLALRLEQAGVATYSDEGYADDSALPVIFIGKMEPTPKAAIGLRVYNEDRGRDRYNPDFYVQLRLRMPGDDQLTVEALGDRIFGVLDFGERPSPEVWPNGAIIQVSHRVVRGSADPNANGDYERPDSYRITANPDG